ncbi:hypothetical protein ACFQ3N_09865 [Virgibacillus byunsanensis]|uniref:ABC transporter periplasmic binding protein yphF n=1 Tax=Virgibacillus byunsanensis TaxID=570945 RepID=A0ABW3LN65_9BACI
MKLTYIRALSALLLVFILSGCLYPNNELSKNQTPNEDQLERIQQAVNTYKEEAQGLVPIKTKDSDTPIFQKYLVDFTALKNQNLISDIPGNAYENGGIYQYTLLTPEDDPRVKLIDLRVTESIRSVNVKLEIYRNKHIYPPFGEEMAEGVYTIDYEALGIEAEYVVSPYSKENLPIVMNTDGELFVDYRVDLYNALQKYDHNYKEGDDIRYILTDHTPFAPAYSMPYTVKNGEPVFNGE